MQLCLGSLSWQWLVSWFGTSVSEIFVVSYNVSLSFQMSLWDLYTLVCVLYTAYVCVFAVYYQCLLGKSCKSDGKCLSPSQWCDGVQDCSHGEDESQCCKTSTFQSSTYSNRIYLCASHQWAAQWLNSGIVLSASQFVSTGPIQC